VTNYLAKYLSIVEIFAQVLRISQRRKSEYSSDYIKLNLS